MKLKPVTVRCHTVTLAWCERSPPKMLWEVVQEPVVHLNASLQDLKNISAREVWTYCASARFAMCEVIAASKFTGSVSQETVTTIRSTYSQTIWSPSLVNVLTCIVYSTIGMHFFFMESSFCFRDTAKNPRIMSPKTTHTECFFFCILFIHFVLFHNCRQQWPNPDVCTAATNHSRKMKKEKQTYSSGRRTTQA